MDFNSPLLSYLNICVGNLEVSTRGFDVNQAPSAEVEEGAAVSSSPNSTISSFQMDFSAARARGGEKGGTVAGRSEGDVERASSRASDEDENGLARKKLRLSKEQSAFLEESFKEHNTLNPVYKSHQHAPYIILIKKRKKKKKI